MAVVKKIFPWATIGCDHPEPGISVRHAGAVPFSHDTGALEAPTWLI
jgi:hypothetical protein